MIAIAKSWEDAWEEEAEVRHLTPGPTRLCVALRGKQELSGRQKQALRSRFARRRRAAATTALGCNGRRQRTLRW